MRAPIEVRHFAAFDRAPTAAGKRRATTSFSESALEVCADLSRLVRRQFPAGVGNALPALIAKPLADRSVADAQLGRQLLWCDRLGHPPSLDAASPRRAALRRSWLTRGPQPVPRPRRPQEPTGFCEILAHHSALPESTTRRRCGASLYTSQIFVPARRRVSGVPIHTIALCASQCGDGLRRSGCRCVQGLAAPAISQFRRAATTASTEASKSTGRSRTRRSTRRPLNAFQRRTSPACGIG